MRRYASRRRAFSVEAAILGWASSYLDMGDSSAVGAVAIVTGRGSSLPPPMNSTSAARIR
jgi:hypothetical protein